jgi:hypothetical protein
MKKTLRILTMMVVLGTLLLGALVQSVFASSFTGLVGYGTIGGAGGLNSIGGTVPVIIGAYNTSSLPVVTISAASLVLMDSARLNGNVTSIGTADPTVTVYWGTTDGVNTAGNWANSAAPTSPAQPQGIAAFYLNVTGLNPHTVYYFNVYAFNSSGGVWAGTSRSFTTASSTTTTTTGTTTGGGTGGSTSTSSNIAKTLLPFAVAIVGIVLVVLFVSKGNIKAAFIIGLAMVVATVLTFVLVRVLM